MRFLPFQEYRVEIPPAAVQFEKELSDELSRVCRDPKGVLKSQGVVFSGIVNNGSFKFRRQGFGNTTMIPFIKGEISEAEVSGHSIILMKVMYHPLVYLLISLWFSFVAIVLLLSLIYTLISGKFSSGILFSLILFLFGYGLVMLSFSEEVKRIKKFFNMKWNMDLHKPTPLSELLFHCLRC